MRATYPKMAVEKLRCIFLRDPKKKAKYQEEKDIPPKAKASRRKRFAGTVPSKDSLRIYGATNMFNKNPLKIITETTTTLRRNFDEARSLAFSGRKSAKPLKTKTPSAIQMMLLRVSIVPFSSRETCPSFIDLKNITSAMVAEPTPRIKPML